MLGYLGHLDTVLADPDAWRPTRGRRGRTTARLGPRRDRHEVPGRGRGRRAAHLARSGWRPARGALKLFAVADEETGGALGAQWLTQNRPDLARCDFLLNEGAGTVMPYGDRRLYGVCCAEKGTFRFTVSARGRAGHASVPELPTTRCSSSARARAPRRPAAPPST